jgi:hypothetical protein
MVTLTRLTTAFSRDQQEKVYVHHKLLQHAAEVYAWLESGARVYVSGATDMAHDVFAALVECAARAGNLSPEEADAYGKHLRRGPKTVSDRRRLAIPTVGEGSKILGHSQADNGAVNHLLDFANLAARTSRRGRPSVAAMSPR